MNTALKYFYLILGVIKSGELVESTIPLDNGSSMGTFSNLLAQGLGIRSFLVSIPLLREQSVADPYFTTGESIYVVHELSSAVTEQKLPRLPGNDSPKLLANVSTIPPGAPAGAIWNAAELFVSPLLPIFTPGQRYLYASNRNVATDPSALDPRGDTIVIFETVPVLRVIKQVYTGLSEIRGLAIGGDSQHQYISAAGLTGGGIAVFEIVDGGKDLTLLARNNGLGAQSVSSFVWL